VKSRLYENVNEGGGTTVTLELKGDGSISLFYHDAGKTAREMFGDGDYEAWLAVPAGAVPALCFALLKEAFSGEGDALTRARDLCKRNGVKHDTGAWS
jgi:hypothetical protein